MDKFFGSVDTRNGIHFPVLPTTYCDELSYLEVVSKLIELVNELIKQCNLNTEDKVKLEQEWKQFLSELEKDTSDLQTSIASAKDLYDKLVEWVRDNANVLQINQNVHYLLDNKFYLTLKEYGCAGDKTTDDTSKIQQAINEGNIIIGEKDKTYLVDGTLQLRHDTTLINCSIFSNSYDAKNSEGRPLTESYCKKIIMTNGHSLKLINCKFASKEEQMPAIEFKNGTSVSGLASNVIAVMSTSNSGDIVIDNCYFVSIGGVYYDSNEATSKNKIKLAITNSVFNHTEIAVFTRSNDLDVVINNVIFKPSLDVKSTLYHNFYIFYCKSFQASNIKIEEVSFHGNEDKIIGDHLHFYAPGGLSASWNKNELYDANISNIILKCNSGVCTQNNGANLNITNGTFFAKKGKLCSAEFESITRIYNVSLTKDSAKDMFNKSPQARLKYDIVSNGTHVSYDSNATNNRLNNQIDITNYTHDNCFVVPKDGYVCANLTSNTTKIYITDYTNNFVVGGYVGRVALFVKEGFKVYTNQSGDFVYFFGIN